MTSRPSPPSATWSDAACQRHPRLPWDSDSDGPRVERAVRICWAVCPVRAACLADALHVETLATAHGVRGGLTLPERRRLLVVVAA